MPPTRDEESETQRKAHAKRVRETRRSTQGVTLDEIKSAEQLVKMKNANNNGNVSRKEIMKDGKFWGKRMQCFEASKAKVSKAFLTSWSFLKVY